jgi:hypothetical protein
MRNIKNLIIAGMIIGPMSGGGMHASLITVVGRTVGVVSSFQDQFITKVQELRDPNSIKQENSVYKDDKITIKLLKKNNEILVTADYVSSTIGNGSKALFKMRINDLTDENIGKVSNYIDLNVSIRDRANPIKTNNPSEFTLVGGESVGRTPYISFNPPAAR